MSSDAKEQASAREAQGNFEVINERGLHARAAAKLVQCASSFPCEVTLERDGQRANAKSVMGVLLLCGAQGTRMTVTTTGESATDALAAIEDLFARGFDEL